MTDSGDSQIFAMSAFEGLRVLRTQQIQYPEMALTELVDLVRRVDADGNTYNYDGAIILHKMVPPTAPVTEAIVFYQHCIEVAIPEFRPLWGRIITLGRKKFAQKLSRDEGQCFRNAGLLDDPPTTDIISWWDRVASTARLHWDQTRMERARQAEEMSLKHEIEQLKQKGISLKPIWMAVEDNTAGYDIQSYEIGSGGPVARLIEVKSTIVSPLRFRLSRNEWEAAKKYGNSYFFHIWDMQNGRLHERTVAEITPHIPTDNEKGRWENTEIPVL